MARFIDALPITNYVRTGFANWNGEYEPGDKVKISGVYACVGCDKERLMNEGDLLTAQKFHRHTSAQGPIRWKLLHAEPDE
jgi:hypothetical protein